MTGRFSQVGCVLRKPYIWVRGDRRSNLFDHGVGSSTKDRSVASQSPDHINNPSRACFTPRGAGPFFFVFLCIFRPKNLHISDFFRTFTVEKKGNLIPWKHTQITLFIHTLKNTQNYEQNSKDNSPDCRLHYQRPVRCLWRNYDDVKSAADLHGQTRTKESSVEKKSDKVRCRPLQKTMYYGKHTI